MIIMFLLAKTPINTIAENIHNPTANTGTRGLFASELNISNCDKAIADLVPPQVRHGTPVT